MGSVHLDRVDISWKLWSLLDHRPDHRPARQFPVPRHRRTLMPIQIALIGLGRLGGSIGMALGAQNGLQIAGFDRDPDAMRVAQSRGAVHRTEWNLINAVEGADLVLLALPLAEQRDILAALAPRLPPPPPPEKTPPPPPPPPPPPRGINVWSPAWPRFSARPSRGRMSLSP